MGKALERFNINKIRVIAICLLAILIILSSSNFVYGLNISSYKKENIEKINYKLFFEEPIINEVKLYGEEFTQINIKNCISHADPGYPTLPIYPLKILLPWGKKLSNIKISNKKSIELKDNFLSKPIFPQQKPILIGLNNDVVFEKNIAVYSSSKPIVDNIIEDVEIGYCRGYTILSLIINPVQYIPKKGKLFYYSEISLNIELQDDASQNLFYRGNLADKDWVENLVFNPQETKKYMNSELPILSGYSDGLCNQSEDYDYVIITTTSGGLDDWATSESLAHNWTSLINKHTSDYGFNCNLVLVDDIVNCSDYWNDTAIFNDTTAKIREFCKDAYMDWNTSYILIGGDDEIIPAREMDYAFESNVDSDIYWSNLDNSFNADQDSNWGEEGDNGFDLYSELYIGRLTCDEPLDVSNWMNKSFTYTDSNSNDYIENAGFYAGNTGWTCQGDDFIDFSAIQGTNSWLGPNPDYSGPYPSWAGFLYGFETWNSENINNQYDLSVKWTAEPPNTGWSGGSDSAAINGLKNAINSNNITLLSGIAHANSDMSLDVTSANWESNYHNTQPFFLHDYGCHCGDMDASDDGVLHSMLFHSDTELAFACVYNTGYGFGNEYSTNSSSSFQQKLFWDYFFDTNNNSISTDNWQLGKAMAYSKDTMASTINWDSIFGTWRGVIQGCLLFGDPAQKLKAPSQNINLSNEDPSNGTTNISPGNITLSISVFNGEEDTMNITFRTNESDTWQDIGINNSQENGNYQQSHIFSNYSTRYWWSVNVSDITGNNGWNNETYFFTTRAEYIPNTPGSFIAIKHNRSVINLTWDNADSNLTYIEYNTIESWMRGQGNILENSSNTSLQHTNLSFGTTYYYQAWSWNQTDNSWSINNVSCNTTTDNNTVPNINNLSPANSSTSQQLRPVCNLTISDIDYDLITIYIYENTTGNWTLQQIYQNHSGDLIIWNNFTNASNYNTKYYWRANCTDGYNWNNETYHFTTVKNQAPTFSDLSISNGSTGVSISTSSISLTITDNEDDIFNWSITTSPNIGNSLGNNNSSGIKSCSITSLSYSTKYYWYVSAIDTVNNTWSNATYWFQTENQPYNGGGSTGGSGAGTSTNNEPETPSTPEGASSGYVNTSYNYSTVSTDSDDDQIKYKFDWGDGTYSDWSELLESGTQASFSHIWVSSGVYEIKAQAKDENGATSSWSDLIRVSISDKTTESNETNSGKIIVNIPDNTSVNSSLIFDFIEINSLDEQNLTYIWDFGDGTSIIEKNPDHSYSKPGVYTVKLRIYDEKGNLINSTKFEITIKQDSKSQTQNLEESTNEKSTMPLLMIFLIGGIIASCLLLFILRRRFASIFFNYDITEDEKEHIKDLKVIYQKLKGYKIDSRDTPPDMYNAFYNKDIVKISPEQNLENINDKDHFDEIRNKHTKKHINKTDLKDESEIKK